MRRTRLFLFVLTAVVLVIGSGLLFLLNLDLNNYKSGLERLIGSEMGRQFVIDGRADISFGEQVSLTLTDVRLGNPDWAASEDMVQAGRVTVVLNLRSLLSDAMIIELVELDDATLNLEKVESGVNNWTFPVDSEQKSNDHYSHE